MTAAAIDASAGHAARGEGDPHQLGHGGAPSSSAAESLPMH